MSQRVFAFALLGCLVPAHIARANEAPARLAPAWELPPLFDIEPPSRFDIYALESVRDIRLPIVVVVFELEDEDAVVAPKFGDFPRALEYNFMKGLFSRANLTPFLIGVRATLAARPFDEDVSDALRDSANGWGDAGQVAGGRYVIVGATAAFLLATPFVKNPKFRFLCF